MRLGVISDSHGDTASLRIAAERMGAVDAYAHLGDGARDTRALEDFGKPIYVVRGNMDARDDAPGELTIDFAGLRVLLTHGDRYGVKFSKDRLLYRAMECEARIVLYGHTHVPDQFIREGIRFFNPGSVARTEANRGNALLLIPDEGWRCERIMLCKTVHE